MFRNVGSKILNRLDGGRQEEALRRLHAELRDLQDAVRTLRAEVGELRRAARPPGERHLLVVEERCIGCGTCVDLAPGVFALDASGKARVLVQDGAEDAVRAAVEACPTSCITW